MTDTKINRKTTIGAMKLVTKIEDIFYDELSETMTRKGMNNRLRLVLGDTPVETLTEVYSILVKKYDIVSHTHFSLLTEAFSLRGVNTLPGLDVASETVMMYKRSNTVFEIERDDYEDDDDEEDEPADVKRRITIINKDKIPTFTQRIRKRAEYLPKKCKSNTISCVSKIKHELGI